MTTFPSWRTGPNGERRVFEKAEDVPDGWVDGLHPSVRQGLPSVVSHPLSVEFASQRVETIEYVGEPEPAPRVKRRYTRRQQ